MRRTRKTDWREIPGYAAYEVSEYGDVRWHLAKSPTTRFLYETFEPGTLLRAGFHRGRFVTWLKNDEDKWATVHTATLVALAFVGPRPSQKHWVLHKDDDPTNDYFSNLYWGTAKQNVDDAVTNGTRFCKIPRSDYPLIRERYYSSDITQRELAREYAVTQPRISHILTSPKGYK